MSYPKTNNSHDADFMINTFFWVYFLGLKSSLKNMWNNGLEKETISGTMDEVAYLRQVI